jgi:hypothetical protein
MTCDPIDGGRWKLTFEEPEAAFLMNVLVRLARHYREDLGQLSPGLRRFWQNGSSVAATEQPAKGAEAEESREVLSESRAELRSERLALAESWLRDFELAEEPWEMEMTNAERDEFVAMLNDRRLILAVEAGVTREEHITSSKGALEDRRAAILEIDVLGHFIMVLLGPQIYRP